MITLTAGEDRPMELKPEDLERVSNFLDELHEIKSRIKDLNERKKELLEALEAIFSQYEAGTYHVGDYRVKVSHKTKLKVG